MLDQTKARIRAKLYQPVNALGSMTVTAIVLACIAIILSLAALNAH